MRSEADTIAMDPIVLGRVLRDDAMTTVVHAWNDAGGERQARCHIPRHGLATAQGGKVDWFASICFECANVYIDGPSATAEHRIIDFAGNAFEARLNAGLREVI